jgi:hypothetical protein
MTRLRVILSAVAILGLILCGWALHRMGPAGILDPKWPRPLPYPDTILNAYHDWLDARYPAAPGTIKLHGEIYRVQMTLWGIFVCLATVLYFTLAPVLRRFRFQQGATPNSRPPSQSPGSSEIQSSDSQRTSSSGGCG